MIDAPCLDPRSPGRLGMLACILEVSAQKAGNVHRWADFEDTSYVDFLLSAAAVSGPLDRARDLGVGRTVLDCVRATQEVARTNTNLGMILLLAPLAAVPRSDPLDRGVATVLSRLSIEDTRLVYQAIRLARPGGLGEVGDHDVSGEPTIDLRAAMSLSAERDLIAAQYASNYNDIFKNILQRIRSQLERGRALETSLVVSQIQAMATLPDSLIARKRGRDVAVEASRRAGELLASGWPDARGSRARFAGFDAWLRADGHARNPGAIADLIAASLYAGLYDGSIDPRRVPWSDSWGVAGSQLQ